MFVAVTEVCSRRHVAERRPWRATVCDLCANRTNLLPHNRLEPYQIARCNSTFLCVSPQVELSNGYKPRVGHWPEHRIGSEAARADTGCRRRANRRRRRDNFAIRARGCDAEHCNTRAALRCSRVLVDGTVGREFGRRAANRAGHRSPSCTADARRPTLSLGTTQGLGGKTAGSISLFSWSVSLSTFQRLQVCCFVAVNGFRYLEAPDFWI